MPPPWKERFENYFEPGELLMLAVQCKSKLSTRHGTMLTVISGYISNLFSKIVKEGSLRPLLEFSKNRSEAFSRLWLMMCKSTVATIFDINCSPSEAPPAEAHDPTQALPGAFAPLPGLLASVHGDVLELGPGSGGLFRYLDSAKIKTMYGAEPAEELYEALRTSADAIGLKDKFSILPCGGQFDSLLPALSEAEVLQTQNKGEECVFDTVVAMRSLCSIPHLEESLETIYRLLRPGGRLLICEHVVNPWPAKGGSLVGRMFQLLYTVLGWTYFFGGCHLSRDTIGLLYKAAEVDGGWGAVELQRDQDWAALPFVTGTFLKK